MGWGILRSSKNPPIFEEPLPIFEETLHFQSSMFEAEDRRPAIFVLRSRRSKNIPPSSIFGAEDRRLPHLQSSIFGAEDRRPLIFDPRRMGRRSDRRRGGFFEDGGGSSIFRVRRTKNLPPSSTFSARRKKSPPIFHFLGRKNGRRTPLVPLLPTPPSGHQLPSAILRAGSSDRSSTLKIGPEIEIGPLLGAAHGRAAGGPGRGRTGRRRIGPPRREPSLAFPMASNISVFERFFRFTNKRNPMQIDGGTR